MYEKYSNAITLNILWLLEADLNFQASILQYLKPGDNAIKAFWTV